jgi:hypothetical protein
VALARGNQRGGLWVQPWRGHTDRNSCKRQQAATNEQATSSNTASRLFLTLVAASSTFDSSAATTTPFGSKQPVVLAAVRAVVGPPSLCVSADAPGSKRNRRAARRSARSPTRDNDSKRQGVHD